MILSLVLLAMMQQPPVKIVTCGFAGCVCNSEGCVPYEPPKQKVVHNWSEGNTVHLSDDKNFTFKEVHGVPPPGPEPLDVPADYERYVVHHKGEYWGCGLDVCTASEDKYDYRPTCADKSRILEHDENSPPKYWCRRVQP